MHKENRCRYVDLRAIFNQIFGFQSALREFVPSGSECVTGQLTSSVVIFGMGVKESANAKKFRASVAVLFYQHLILFIECQTNTTTSRYAKAIILYSAINRKHPKIDFYHLISDLDTFTAITVPCTEHLNYHLVLFMGTFHTDRDTP